MENYNDLAAILCIRLEGDKQMPHAAEMPKLEYDTQSAQLRGMKGNSLVYVRLGPIC